MMRMISHLSAPVHVWWDVTRRCNFKCRHCYSQAGQVSVTELTTAEAKGVIDQLSTMRIGYVYMLGGEPLMRPDLPELLEHFAVRDLPVMLNTNGWFVDEVWAQRLAGGNVRHLRFSLDGARPDTHDRFRSAPGSFERVVAAIGFARRAGIPTISVSFTMTKENVHEVRAVVELLAGLDVDAVQFAPVADTGRAADQQFALDAQDTRRVGQVLESCVSEFSKAIHVYSVDGTYDKPCTRCVHAGTVMPAFMGCQAGRTCFCLDWDGNVIPCLLWRDHRAGSVREQSLSEIWDRSQLFQNLRRHRGADHPECRGCFYGDVCARECPLSPSQQSVGTAHRAKEIASLKTLPSPPAPCVAAGHQCAPSPAQGGW